MANKNKPSAPPQKPAPVASITEKKEAIAKAGTLSKDAPLPNVKDGGAPKTEEAPAAEATTGSARNVVDRTKHHYEAHKDVKTAGGRASVDNDDPMAKALRGKDADDVVALVSANGGEINPSWENLNPGLRRMSAGNVLRKLARRSEGVKIDDQVLKLDPLPEDPDRAAAKAAKDAEKAAKAEAKAAEKKAKEDAAAAAKAAKAEPAGQQKAA